MKKEIYIVCYSSVKENNQMQGSMVSEVITDGTINDYKKLADKFLLEISKELENNNVSLLSVCKIYSEDI